MADVIPYWLPGNEYTGHASVALVGGRLVRVSGNPVDGNPRLAVPAAGDPCQGVAARDAALGAKVMVFRGNAIVPVEAGAAITSGQELQCDAAGRVIPLAAGKKVGTAFADAANAAMCMVALENV